MSKIFLAISITIALFFSACSTKRHYYSNYSSYKSSSKPRVYSSNKANYNTHLDKKAYKHPTMRPYVIRGVRYYPHDVKVGDKFRGKASWYGPNFHGKFTSNGERYDMYKMTAASKTLPMNTIVKVTNHNNGLSTVVRINDRGPFIATRIIDLSNSAAKKIKMIGTGTAPVTLEVLGFYSKNKKKVKTYRKKVTVAKAKPKSKPKPKPKQNTKTSYALQIASFSNIEGALKVQEDSDDTDGYKTIIKDVETDNGRFFKVYLTGFKTEEEARAYKRDGNFKNSFIVREE
jgi:rare lipoprotein A